jgi:hypothetical protein
MQLANTRVRTEWGWRQRSIARARLSAIPTNPRWGRLMLGCRRCLIAGDGVASMRELKAWCYVGRPHAHWQYEVIREALVRIGARRIGWCTYAIR